MRKGKALRKLIRRYVLLTLGLVILASYNSCGFKEFHTAEIDSSTLNSQLALEGLSLFSQSCAGCHFEKSFFADRNLNPVQMEQLIHDALENVPSMAILQGQVTDIDVRSIAIGLSSSGDVERLCRDDRSAVKHIVSGLLSPREYENSVNDLLGVSLKVKIKLPANQTISGFDNNSDAQNLTPSRVEAFLAVAEEVAAEAIAKNPQSLINCATNGSLSDPCIRTSLQELANRVYRRPASSQEVEILLRSFQAGFNASQGGSSSVGGRTMDNRTKGGLTTAVVAALMSPHFLFKNFRAPNPKDPQSIGLISDYELASRLSYFLWSSTPDQTLINLAKNNQLGLPQVLDQQVDRMLRSSKAESLITAFGEKWFHLDRLATTQLDPGLFPEFNENLRADMKKESELFLKEVFLGNGSLMDLLVGDYTYVNRNLASHYGIRGVGTEEFQRVSLAGLPRRGLLTHGSMLVLTSNPDESNIVRRGVNVMENFLCSPPPPPPPDISTALQNQSVETRTPREQMIAHRKDPSCVACHAVMDPIGFSLEPFNALGQWRNFYSNGEVIDPTGSFPDGQFFSGAVNMVNTMAESEQFLRCVSEKALTFALNSLVNQGDECFINHIMKNVDPTRPTFAGLIKAIVKSPSFRKQKGD